MELQGTFPGPTLCQIKMKNAFLELCTLMDAGSRLWKILGEKRHQPASDINLPSLNYIVLFNWLYWFQWLSYVGCLVWILIVDAIQNYLQVRWALYKICLFVHLRYVVAWWLRHSPPTRKIENSILGSNICFFLRTQRKKNLLWTLHRH